MQPEHEHEISRLRAEQLRIRGLVHGIDRRIDTLADSLAALPPPEPIQFASIIKPSLLPRTRNVQPSPPVSAGEVNDLPLIESPARAVSSAPTVDTHSTSARETSVSPGDQSDKRERNSEPSPIDRPTDVSHRAVEEPFELALGRIWLVRIGMVILLTGLVFLGNLAYQHIVPLLGPGAKLAMIYAAGAALAGVGLRIEKTRESLRNYARVLLAGGCGTIYYATYAAHYVAPLRVIDNSLIAGTLLLGLAGVIAWMAHRRESQTLATVAILLSYYSSGLNPIGSFTLFSCLLLTAAAIFFLVRHRWVRLTAISLAGTYLSYAWCRYSGGAGADSLVTQFAFLGGYWLLFTAGGLLADRNATPPSFRTPFLSINNAAFFAFGTVELYFHHSPDFWVFSCCFGVALLALGLFARWKYPEDRLVDSAFFVQGLALTTLGLCAKLTGYQLSLALAAQSVVLLCVNGDRHRVLRAAAGVLCILGSAWLAWSGLMMKAPHSAVTAAMVAAALGLNAWILKRRYTTASVDELEPVTCGLIATGLALGVGAIWQAVGWPHAVSWIAAAAVAFAALTYVWRFIELTVLSQALLPIAASLWILTPPQGNTATIAEPLILLCSGTALALWWQRQSRFRLNDYVIAGLEAAASAVAVAVALVWIDRTYKDVPLIIATSVVGTAWLAASLGLRARFLTLGGLAFTAGNLILFARDLSEVSVAVSLLPIAHVLAVCFLASHAQRLGTAGAEMRSLVQAGCDAIASLMGLAWTFTHVPEPWLPLIFATAASGLSILGALRQRMDWSIGGLALGGLAWVMAVFFYQHPTTWQNLAAIIVFPAACRFARKISLTDPTHPVTPYLSWATTIGVTMWSLQWLDSHSMLMSLTILWTLLALAFSATGLVLKDRHYRVGGLVLIGFAVARVFLIDVWAFDQVMRIVTFILLGTTLLLLGYFYNRFAENLRRWL